MERQIQKSITITNHAMKRLKERVKTFGDHKSWQDLVKDARYNDHVCDDDAGTV